jgi:hypothetical protein
MRRRRAPVRDARRGSVAAAAIVLVALCAATAAGAVIANSGATREAETYLARERAFQAAESGLDWGITQIRILGGVIPATPEDTRTVDRAARFTVRYLAGTANASDDDDDGAVDEADEGAFSAIVSTGASGGVERTIQVLVKKGGTLPGFPGAVIVANDLPIVDLFSGGEHTLDGALDTSRTAAFGIASLAPVTSLVTEIGANAADQISGTGSLPSAGQVVAPDLVALLGDATTAATLLLEEGTYTGGEFGTTDPGGAKVVVGTGDVHLSGGTTGAGILAIDGDLTISGGFEWTGLVLVTGRLTLTGGGGGTRVVGAILVGDELRVTGTVDLAYSTDAVAFAASALSPPRIVAWRETGKP